MIPNPLNFKETKDKLYLGQINCDLYIDTLNIVNSTLKGDEAVNIFFDKIKTDTDYYKVEVNQKGIFVEGNVYNALSTLTNLIKKDNDGDTFVYFCDITDYPKYSYRSFLLDESRHFQGMEIVKYYLDLMFKLKLNKFHWHLSDDQGFRIYLNKYPELIKATQRKETMVGWTHTSPKSDHTPHSGYYTESDIKDIIFYAKVRGIEVIPEFNPLTHLSAVLSVYPEFTYDKKPFEVPGNFGVLDHNLCIGSDKAMQFAKNLMLEIANLFSSHYFYLGFDELKTDNIAKDEDCLKKMRELGLTSPDELVSWAKAYFISAIKNNGLIPIVYNDSLNELNTNVISQHWKGKTEEKTIELINAGQKTIISPFYTLYMDYPYALTPLKKTFNFNPMYKKVTKSENILGIDSALWTEYIADFDNLKYNSLYRLAASAEVAWRFKKRSYHSFIRELRENEEYYFQENLNIKENILNNIFPIRLSRMLKTIKYDMQYEYKIYQKGKENGNKKSTAK